MAKRIAQIDGYRGLLLFGMTWNHLILFPFIGIEGLRNWLFAYVYNSCGYFSNSEGFFFLAGLVSGLVYGRRVLEGENVWRRVKGRIFQMYLAHILLLLGVSVALCLSTKYLESWIELHELIPIWKGQEGILYFLNHPVQGFFLGACFLYALPFFDILPLFMLFLAVTPMILEQLRKERMIAVLRTSIALWIFVQVIPSIGLEGIMKQWLPVKLGWFNPFAVQLLFIAGLAIGFAYVRGSLISVKKLILMVLALLLITYSIFRLGSVDLLRADCLGFARLSFFFVKAVIAYLLLRHIPFRPFEILGRNSLPIFVYHLILVYVMTSFLPIFLKMPIELQLISLFACIASLWVVANALEKKALQSLFVR